MSATIAILTGIEMIALDDGQPNVVNGAGTRVPLAPTGTPRPSKTFFAAAFNLGNLVADADDRTITFTLKIPQGIYLSDMELISRYAPLVWTNITRAANGPIFGTNFEATAVDMDARTYTVRLRIDQYQMQIVNDEGLKTDLSAVSEAQGYVFVDFKHSLV